MADNNVFTAVDQAGYDYYGDGTDYSDCWTYPKEKIDELVGDSLTGIETTKEEAIAAVQEAGSDAVQEIEEKGEETLESIPDDYTQLSNDVSELKADLNNSFETLMETVEAIIDVEPTVTKGMMDKNGTVSTASTLSYTQKIAVKPGDIVYAYDTTGVHAINFRFLTAFYDDTPVPSAGSDTLIDPPYTVPDGVNYIVLTLYDNQNCDLIQIYNTTTVKRYGVKPIPMGYMSDKESLSSGDSMTLPYHNVKINNIYIFNASISNFSSITFSKGDYSITVDSTNITVVNDDTGAIIPHGLTIGVRITLMVENETSTNTSLIRLCSDGDVFSYTTPIRFVMDNGSATVLSNGSILTNCTLSWVSKNINTPIWMFGDSYFSWYPERWTYYLAEDGYTDVCMLNGFAGQTSATAYNALVNLLNITTPKMVVWCLGMNDGDTSSAVNESWKTYYDKVIALKNKYGFELILYTVPTTPVVNNMYKNAIVRESGYRYVEADLAVRTDAYGNWVTGALSTDDVHPTAIGAKILYYAILADLPELMCLK